MKQIIYSLNTKSAWITQNNADLHNLPKNVFAFYLKTHKLVKNKIQSDKNYLWFKLEKT